MTVDNRDFEESEANTGFQQNYVQRHYEQSNAVLPPEKRIDCLHHAPEIERPVLFAT